MADNLLPIPTTPDTITTLFGNTISATIAGTTPHAWAADASGLFHTATDLATEWHGLYEQMLNGSGAALTAVQRMEGNAEAVFENTGLAGLSQAQQATDREDAQREFDAIAAAMQVDQVKYGIDPDAQFTQRSYLRLEETIQSDPTLQELAIQGHGLNDPPSVRYEGYTNDFQNNVDQVTRFIGGGIDNNEKAIADVFDDVVLSHVPFPTVAQNGHLEQLNQNGAAEDTLVRAIEGLNQSAFDQVFLSADFTHPGVAHPKAGPVDPVFLPRTLTSPTPPAGSMLSLDGFVIPDTITGTPHTWTADANGLYQTSTDLGAEWLGLYDRMLAGGAAGLTPIQRLEGNAEAVFLNTGLSKLDAATQARDREDAQREFDAMAAAMRIDAHTLGIDPRAAFTQTSYLAMEHTLQDHPALEELAIQGHGLNDPTASRYDGYTNDFQNGVDGKTRYVGGGLNSGDNALRDFMDDNILSHSPFPVVARNGRLVQLNQNGAAENTLAQAVLALDESMFYRTYVASDFKGG